MPSVSHHYYRNRSCADCGTRISDDATYCRSCFGKRNGVHLRNPQRYCADCGTPISRNATKCGSCAKRFPKDPRPFREKVVDPKTIARFLAKVDKDSHPGGCWLWTGSRNERGYGAFGIYPKVYTASRVAHEMFIGPIADGLFVLHSCDNPSCVNPAHLSAGTQEENVRQCYERGRRAPMPSNRQGKR